MKIALSLLLFAAFTVAACNTLATRRDLYAPEKGSGPYTDGLNNGTWIRGVQKPRKPAATPKATPAPAATAAPVLT